MVNSSLPCDQSYVTCEPEGRYTKNKKGCCHDSPNTSTACPSERNQILREGRAVSLRLYLSLTNEFQFFNYGQTTTFVPFAISLIACGRRKKKKVNLKTDVANFPHNLLLN